MKIENAITELVELTKVNGKLCVQILPRQSETDYIVVEKLSGSVVCSIYSMVTFMG